MTHSPLVELDASELARRIHAREITSVEATRAHLDRIDAVDGDREHGVHAFLHVDRDGALAAAQAVDRALDAGLRTRDLGGEATTAEATRAVIDNLPG